MLQANQIPSSYRPVSRQPVYFGSATEDISQFQLKDMCTRIDSYNGDKHCLSKIQFAEFLRGFGLTFDNDRLQRVYAMLNHDRAACFDLERYCVHHYSSDARTERRELVDAFTALDKDGSGKIDRREIRAEMKRRNVFNEQYLDQVLADADKNGDGKVNYREFLDLAEIL